MSAAKFATIDGDSKPNKYQSGLESPYDNYDSNHVYEQKEKRSSSIKPDRYQRFSSPLITPLPETRFGARKQRIEPLEQTNRKKTVNHKSTKTIDISLDDKIEIVL